MFLAPLRALETYANFAPRYIEAALFDSIPVFQGMSNEVSIISKNPSTYILVSINSMWVGLK
jgi:hypothetical protein